MKNHICPAPRFLFAVTGLGGGGAENALLALCGHLIRQRPGARIRVVSLLSAKGAMIETDLRRLNVEVISLQDTVRRREVWRCIQFILELIEFRPQVIQGWMYHGNVAAWLLRNLLFPPIRLVGSVHSLWSAQKQISRFLSVARSLNRLAVLLDFDHTFYAGQASLAQHIAAGFPARVSSVLPNGIALAQALIPSTAETPVPILVHIARAHLDKDNANFIRTVALLEERQFRCDVIVLGTGLDRSFMRRELPGYEAFRYVKVEALGFRKDVPAILRNASVVFLSSKSEAFPVSLVEGLGAGVVCVSTDVGDCREIIGDCGETVPPARPDLLADALVRWASESHCHRQMWAARCHARARARFSIEAMGRIYWRLLDNLGRDSVV